MTHIHLRHEWDQFEILSQPKVTFVHYSAPMHVLIDARFLAPMSDTSGASDYPCQGVGCKLCAMVGAPKAIYTYVVKKPRGRKEWLLRLYDSQWEEFFGIDSAIGLKIQARKVKLGEGKWRIDVNLLDPKDPSMPPRNIPRC